MAILLPNDYVSTLPSEYQELEYIESTGTQYIDTDVNCDANVSCDAVMTWTKLEGYFLGAYVGGHDHYLLRGQSNNAYTYDGHHVGSSWATVNTKYNIRSQMWSGDQKFIVDGVEKFSSTYSSTMNNNRPLYLFCSNDIEDGAYAKCSAKLYSMKIYHSSFDNVVRDYVPAKRKSDNAVGLYDTVSQTFFTNKGTGTFLHKEIPTMIDVKNVIYNGVQLDKVIFDGVVVWESFSEPFETNQDNSWTGIGTVGIDWNGDYSRSIISKVRATGNIQIINGDRRIWLDIKLEDGTNINVNHGSGSYGTSKGTTNSGIGYTINKQSYYVEVTFDKAVKATKINASHGSQVGQHQSWRIDLDVWGFKKP